MSRAAQTSTETLGANPRPRGWSLRLRQPRTVDLIRAVERGFPITRLAHFQKVSGLSLARIAQCAGIPRRTISRRQREGRLDAAESERLLRLSRTFELAVELFDGDIEAARHWLERPQRALGGERPIEFAAMEVGAREVENLIGRLEHGVFT